AALDSAKLSNVITAFVIYQDWDKRPAGLSQMSIIGDLQQRLGAVQRATFAVLPPSPIPGLGTAFGFDMMIEDRTGSGLAELQKSVNEVLGSAQDRPGFLRVGFTTFSATTPQLYLDIDRTMAESLCVTV